MTFDGLNFGAIFLATLLSTLLGVLMYRDVLQKRIKIIWIFLLAFIIAFFLASMIEVIMFTGSNTMLGLLYGAILGLFFITTSLGISGIVNNKSFKSFLKDAGFMLLVFLLMGAIIGGWQ